MALNLFCCLGESSAAVINFDDIATGTFVPNLYAGLTWDNFLCINGDIYSPPNSGYSNGVISHSNVVLNAYGTQAGLHSDTAFSFGVGYFTAAWRNGLNLTIDAYSGGTGGILKYTVNMTLNTSAPSMLVANLSDIDTMIFTTSGGVNAGLGDDGAQFVLDNLMINGQGGSSVPEPTSMAIFVVGALVIGYRNRRKLLK